MELSGGYTHHRFFEGNLSGLEVVEFAKMLTLFRGPKGESVLHLAANQGHLQIINMAADLDCKSRVLLLSGENSKGETPLHVAAASGELEVVDAILKLSKTTDKLGMKKPQYQLLDKEQVGVVIEPTLTHSHQNEGELALLKQAAHDQVHHTAANSSEDLESEWKPWRSKSGNGDTPTHMALRNGHKHVAMQLLEWDPQLIFTSVNKANESLLYLAALTGCENVLAFIFFSFRRQSDYSMDMLSSSGPSGQNALHAGLRCSQVFSTKKSDAPSFNFDKPNDESLQSIDQISDQPTFYSIIFMSHLFNKVDNNGKTPLHLAAELGRLNEVIYMVTEDKVEITAAYKYDNEGFTPLLRAAANGFDVCANEIYKNKPLSLELRHAYNGRTMLHLLKFSDLDMKFFMKSYAPMKKMINEIDNDGNTPLHFAILESDVKKAQVLLSTKGVKLEIKNKQHQTPMDLCTKLRTMGNSKQLLIWIALEAAKAREEKRRSSVPLLLRINTLIMTYSGQQMSTDEDLKKLLENVAVVAALLITLTFAATFTIPGGYEQTTGQALRMKEASVKVFVASNVVAMLLGIGVLLTYTFGASRRAWLRVLAIPCVVMLQCALLGTIVAFISGVYAVVTLDAKWIAIMSVAIVGCVLVIFSITPAAADFVSSFFKLVRDLSSCTLKWLLKAGKVMLTITLLMPLYLAKCFGQHHYVRGIIQRLPSI